MTTGGGTFVAQAVSPARRRGQQLPRLTERKKNMRHIPIARFRPLSRRHGSPMAGWRTVLLVVIALALMSVSAASGGRTAPKCVDKTTTIGGAMAIVFCGPAVATIRAVGRTFRIVGGTCQTQFKIFYAHVGTDGGPRQGLVQKLPLFNLIFKPSAPSGPLLYWIVDGKRYRGGADTRAVLKGRTVTFSGRLAKGPGDTGSGAFSGTLNCGA